MTRPSSFRGASRHSSRSAFVETCRMSSSDTSLRFASLLFRALEVLCNINIFRSWTNLLTFRCYIIRLCTAIYIDYVICLYILQYYIFFQRVLVFRTFQDQRYYPERETWQVLRCNEWHQIGFCDTGRFELPV